MIDNWDLLVLGKKVLTMVPGDEVITDGAIAVSDGRIATVGRASDLLDKAPTCELLDAGNCVVMPGLVNTHSHLAMTLMRGLADDLPLMTWLEEYIWPVERRQMNGETIALGTTLAAAEQLLAGVTTTADMYFYADVVCETLADIGMRAVVAESMIDTATPRCATPETMLVKQRELCEKWTGNRLITPSVAPHSPYTVCAANLVKEAELADTYDVPLQIHLSETRWEVETMHEQRGVTPVAYLEDLGFLSERVVAAHCVHVSPEDIGTLATNEVGVSHNPISNLKLASGIAPVPEMLQAGVKLSMGTDGAASNNTLDLLRDLQMAALLHKGSSGDPTMLPARSALELVTSAGARVLGLDKKIGMLKPGFEADIACFETTGMHATPLYDPLSHMVFAARSSDLRHTIVRGKVLVRDRKLKTIDEQELTAKVSETAERIRQS